MSKEIYISSTPHETRLAIVEDDNLTEIYYERENEYTLAGSIYNGKVTRVLPGMQSSFVDIGLERDAFLYITDFMEEAPDSAEFETNDSGSRAPRLEASSDGQQEARGDRGGRSRRGRGDRDRGYGTESGRSESARPEGEPAASSEQGEFAAEGGESEPIGEGAPGADGGRRWRGRRGRRRGRGNNGASTPRADLGTGTEERTGQAYPSQQQPEGYENADGESPIYPAEVEAELDEDIAGELYPEAPAIEAGTIAEEGGSHRENRGAQQDGRRGDRGGRGNRGGRDRGRGKNDRGPRSSRGSYGFEGSEDAAADAPVVEPIILPGESLSKYRKGEDTPAAVVTPVKENVIHPVPSTEYSIPAGWDGGSILPGESLSRHRRIENSASMRREEPVSLTVPAAQIEEPVVALSHPVAEILPPEQAQEIIVPQETEYEPEEASASYRVDPTPAREFRQSMPVEEHAEPAAEEHVEPVAEEPVETAAQATEFGHTHMLTPEPITAVKRFHEAEINLVAALPEHDVTTVQASGEMMSETPQIVVEPVADEEVAEATSPIHHETAVVDAADMVEEPTQIFAPGTGELEEELIDDDEYEIGSLHASHHEEDHDDLEEETLEGAADLGSMIREMSIDQITSTPEGDADEEDFEEDFLEESEEPNGAEFEDEEEDSEEAARTDEAVGDFSTEFREPATEGHSEGQTAPERRGGRRDGRRGGRDRERGGRDSSGRARHTGGGGDRGRSGGRSRSMQATDLPAINELLKPGQEILVQIAKEPIAKKGARITSHIALPGRFLVFMPTVNHTGVSRKIESDGERRRLKEILLSEKGEASGGFIVRTAASGASEEELRSDLRFLLNLWADIKQRSESSKSPALIYHDLNLVERILRDQVGDNFSAIWVDTESEYERVLRFLQRFQPSLIRRVKLYLKETPLFEQFGITEEINKALRSKVWLKSGGSIVINQTEALVAIDINTGKFVGKTARLEDTIVKTNLDAIPEIVRQIRLRDLGGIIIIDFIDMDERKNRNKVMAALEEELKTDRAPSKILQFNDFGLVAITRKRVKQSLERTLSTTCNVCVGTGMVKSPVTVCNDIYIEMRKMYKHLDKGDVMLRVHPDVVKQLKSPGTKWLQEMEEMSGKTILVKSDPSLHPEQFDIH